ncbi:hypothetical protein A0H81_11295 [Grifola frondosa]|uniref:Uncharacterized protein n=1 Tax=Grifola frondosa TaxID=5627 RepID=A0A1C7LWF9_GRIFR|nr:hypothetical protein A0H81_11295 [Grifola frondosa]
MPAVRQPFLPGPLQALFAYVRRPLEIAFPLLCYLHQSLLPLFPTLVLFSSISFIPLITSSILSSPSSRSPDPPQCIPLFLLIIAPQFPQRRHDSLLHSPPISPSSRSQQPRSASVGVFSDNILAHAPDFLPIA